MKGFEKMFYEAREAMDKVGDRVVSFGDAIGEATSRAVHSGKATRHSRGNSFVADEGFDENVENLRRSRKTTLSSVPEDQDSRLNSGKGPTAMEDVDLEDSPYGFSAGSRRSSGNRRQYQTIQDEDNDRVNNPMITDDALEENDQHMLAAAARSARSPRTPPPNTSSSRLNAQQAAARSSFNLQSPLK